MTTAVTGEHHASVQRIQLRISGMSCSACAHRVESTLNKLPGVRAAVNFGTRAIIIRALGVERLVRALVLALAAWAVWEFRGARGAIQATLDRDLPVLRAAGFKVDQMTVIHALEKALAAKPSTLALITGMLAAYAVLQAVEGVGLWLLKRWGEYFAVVATSIFLPLEVHDLAKGITTTRVVTFSINVAAVVYLLISKRLFGVRGGRKAYDVERRGEQLLDLERAAMLT